MDILQSGYATGVLLAKAFSILAIIYVPMIVGVRWLPRIDDRGFFLDPEAWSLAMFSGIILGGCLVYFNLDPEYFTVDNILRVDGPWALSYSSFIHTRVNPFNYSFGMVFSQIAGNSQAMNFSIILLLAGATFLLLAYRALRAWGSAAAARGVLFGAMVVIWACYMTMFMVCLGLWLLNLLNFWTLAILTIAIHLHRMHNFPFRFSMLMTPVFGSGHGHGDHGHGHGHGHGGHGHGDHGHGGHGDHGGGHGHGDEHGHDEDHGHGGGHGAAGHGGHDGGHAGGAHGPVAAGAHGPTHGATDKPRQHASAAAHGHH